MQAEILAICKEAKLAYESLERNTNANIYGDNQAAIKTLEFSEFRGKPVLA